MFAVPPPSPRPPRWARSGHAQTILGALLPCSAAPYAAGDHAFVRVALDTRDGDVLSGWFHGGESGRAVLLLHGLGGSADSPYLRRAARLAARRGWSVLALDLRGSGPGAARSARPYMTGHWPDVADAIAWLRARVPAARILAVGFSLGGNTLLRHLGRPRVDVRERPDLALCVAAPLDLERTSTHLLRWPARGYDLHILRACRRWIPRLRGVGPDPPRYRVSPLASLRVFDRDYIAPVWGFPSREAYYAYASSGPLLRHVRTPTVLLACADDPIVELASLTAFPRSPHVDLHVLPSGGHLGFLGRRGARRADEGVLAHYLGAAERAFHVDARAARPSPEELPCAR